MDTQPMVEGLLLVTDFLDMETEDALVAYLDSQSWDTSLARRVQQYGYRYDYRRRHTTDAAQTPPIPAPLASVATRLEAEGYATLPLNQLIVNEYLPGQGIAAHIDSVSSFGAEIISISLLSPIVMCFKNRQVSAKVDLTLPPRSLLKLSGDARYVWSHEIPKRKNDGGVARQRRISLTFRHRLMPER